MSTSNKKSMKDPTTPPNNKNSSNGHSHSPTAGVRFAPDDNAIQGTRFHPTSTETTTTPPSLHTTTTTTNTTPKYRAKELRGNLMREQKDRDPLFYYEVLSVLGVGSMGSVAKVRKRSQVIGGSARQSLQPHFQREKQLKLCYDIPLVGPALAKCWQQSCWKQSQDETDSDRNVLVDSQSSRTSLLHAAAGGVVEDYNDAAHQQQQQAALSPSSEYYDDNLVDSANGSRARATSSTGSTGSKYEMVCAMKSIHLNRVTDPTFVEELKNEVAILKKLDHPHIVKALETFEHRHQIFIVMELCAGGDLYSRDPYTEAEAARIVASITSAISYMHSKNISHRDLKYENILFVNQAPQAEIKLIDFGLSRKFGSQDSEPMTEGVGTIYTMAPEVLKGSYSKEADLWSVGVIAFMLLSSQMPFYGRKRRVIVEQIMKGQYEMRGRRWKRISPQAKAFVQDLLCVDPLERVTATVALSASWLNRRFTATVRNPYQEELESANQSILAYSKYAKIKKIALLICAHKSTTTEIGILRKVFQSYDTERNGQLSYAEFKAALRDAGYSEDEYRSVFDAVDLDGTGKIRYTEFLAATIEAQGAISEERLAEAFDRIDADDSGYISKANLRSLLGDEFPQSEIDAIIDEADLTRDGKISYSEFLALWEVQHEDNRLRSLAEVKQLGTHSGRSTDSEESSVDDATNPSPGGHESVAARASFLESKISSERKVIEAAKEVAKKMEALSTGDHGSANNKAKHVLFYDADETIPGTDAGTKTPPQRQPSGTPIKHVASV